ncbi:MAG TPA: cupin domain-containing protein [Terracidiphilus sp.]|nr:cupin domain-containing protein [Terracidiphilus sp.]
MAVNQSRKNPPPLECLSFTRPQETREFPKGKLELITLNGITFGRATFQPGWRWSTHLKPTAGTGSCQAAHLGIQLSGTMHIRMDDGTEMDIGPGVVNIPPGHDGWVVGNQPVIFIDITGMENYGKQTKAA